LIAAVWHDGSKRPAGVGGTMDSSMKRLFKRFVLVLIALLVVIQFIPVSKTNPPVTREVRWDSAVSRALAQRSCFDCHSNRTTWPWYVRIAPASFFMANHVEDGRRDLNFSEWDKPQRSGLDDVKREVDDGDMPVWSYLLLHPEARLSAAERTQLIDGLKATFLQDPPTLAPRRR
jgi:heme-binding protein